MCAMEKFDHILRSGVRVDFDTPQEFLEAAVEYFKWATKYPLKEGVLFHNRGQVVRTTNNKVRAFTRHGLANHIGITLRHLDDLKARGDGWVDAMDMVDQIMYQQKFENAAAGLLSAHIVARDLGLADKTELTGKDGGPLQTEDLTSRDAADFTSQLSRLAATGGTGLNSSGPKPGDEGGA